MVEPTDTVLKDPHLEVTGPTDTEHIAALYRQPDEEKFLDLLSQRSRIIRDGFAYWCSKGSPENLPHRSDIDPMEMPKLLPNVILLDVQDQPRDYLYRLIGTGVVHHLKKDLTGTRMSEIEHQRPPSRIWESCDTVVQTGCPFMSRIPYVGPHAEFMYGEDIILPLAGEGSAIEKLLVFVAFVRKS